MSLMMFVCSVLLIILLTTDGYNGYSSDSRRVPKELSSHRNFKLLDLGDTCGRTLLTAGSPRIIGGMTAQLGEFPWIAHLGYSSFSNTDQAKLDDFLCGGSVINDRYVLTAAHCASEYQDADLLLVRLGKHQNKAEAETSAHCVTPPCAPPPRDYNIEQTICHPGFTMKEKQHDICLLRVDKPIQFNDYVQSICLPFYEHLQNSSFVDEYLNVAGWGRSDRDSDAASDVLLFANVPVVDLTACKDFFANKSDSFVIGGNQMCAGGQEGTDSCAGDSGGPLMKKVLIEYDLMYFQIGIVSFGHRQCAQAHVPAIYTRVDKYLKWILDHIRK